LALAGWLETAAKAYYRRSIHTNIRLTNPCADAMHLNRAFNVISDNCRYHRPQNNHGLGDNTMRHRALPAATMIVAASLIGITQARLPRPIKDYRDRVTVEVSTIGLNDTIADWVGARSGAPFGRKMLHS
jgi:hypothetical protein